MPKFFVFASCQGNTIDQGVIPEFENTNMNDLGESGEPMWTAVNDEENYIHEAMEAIAVEQSDSVPMPFDQQHSESYCNEPTDKSIKMPTWEDMIILNSSVRGYYSMRYILFTTLKTFK